MKEAFGLAGKLSKARLKPGETESNQTMFNIGTYELSPLQFSLDETPWKVSFEAVVTFSASLAKYSVMDCKQLSTDRARSFLVSH